MSTVGSEETKSKDGTTGTSAPQTEYERSSDNHTSEAIFSPIQGVPLDILHEIIVYCLPLHPTIQSASLVISTLSRVSSTWRTAVHWSPRPWSTLFVTVLCADDLNKCTQLVTRWFQHARSTPLSFFLNISFRARYEDITQMRTFLADLSSIMTRVWHFGLHAQLTRPLLDSFGDLEWTLPQLRILDLFSHSRYDRLNAIAFSSSIFHNSPNLVRVTIQNAISSARDIHHVLPWSQLTRITVVYNISLSRWIEIMNICPMLRRCNFSLDQPDEATSSSLGSSSLKGTHHNLERLDLVTNAVVPFLKPLALYNFPSLRALHVYNTGPFLGSPNPQDVFALRNLHKFSFSPDGEIFSCQHLARLTEALLEMVNLEVLQLQQTTKDFIPLYESMTFNSTAAPILPQLSTLQIWITNSSERQRGEKDEELGPLIKMLSSRSREDAIPVGCSPLRDFVVDVENDKVYEQTKKRFDVFVGSLPPQLRFKISIYRDYRFEQPEGWTYPISI